ncbi:MAG: MarR family winged helix-turn-helix transcriptional regulator [Ktedonobacterales bacterium]
MARRASHKQTSKSTPTVQTPATPSTTADSGVEGSGLLTPSSSLDMVDTSENTNALALANRLRPILLRLHRHLRNEAHDVGVTGIQASLLAAISRTTGVGLGELAQREHVSTPTLVAHIDRLETAGLVERMRLDGGDRRRVSLSVTAAGQAVIETLRQHRTAWLAMRLETLSPAELAHVAEAIEPLGRLVE